MLLMVTGATLAACAVEEGGIEDAADEPFSGKADTFGILDGSPAARGVLHVASMVAKDELMANVGLTRRAATALITARAAAATAANGELDAFPDLAALDLVPHIGALSFAALLGFAQERNYVFDDDDAIERHALVALLGSDSASCYQHLGKLRAELGEEVSCDPIVGNPAITVITTLKMGIDAREGGTFDAVGARTAVRLSDGRACWFDQVVQLFGCQDSSCARISSYTHPTCD
jgi:hypothetical protein